MNSSLKSEPTEPEIMPIPIRATIQPMITVLRWPVVQVAKRRIERRTVANCDGSARVLGPTARFRPMADPSIVRFRRVVSSAYAYLEERRQEVNDLNVFPVADGDTGDNMAMTMRAVMEELDRLDGQEVDEIGRTELVQALARAALMGARGNSGRDPQPDRPRRRRGAGQPARRADRPGAGRLRFRQRRRRRLRLGARAGRGDDADRLPRDGALDRPPARPPRRQTPAARRRVSATSSRTPCSPRSSSARSTTASARSSALPSSSTCCASRASSTPAATAWS